MVAKVDIFCDDTFQMALQFIKWLSLTWFLFSLQRLLCCFPGGCVCVKYFSPISFDDKTLFCLKKVFWSFPTSSTVLNCGSLHQLL